MPALRTQGCSTQPRFCLLCPVISPLRDISPTPSCNESCTHHMWKGTLQLTFIFFNFQNLQTKCLSACIPFYSWIKLCFPCRKQVSTWKPNGLKNLFLCLHTAVPSTFPRSLAMALLELAISHLVSSPMLWQQWKREKPREPPHIISLVLWYRDVAHPVLTSMKTLLASITKTNSGLFTLEKAMLRNVHLALIE